jgi:hypothetical protein
MAAIMHSVVLAGGRRRPRSITTFTSRCSMYGRFAVALAWGGLTAMLAGCSSGKDAGARADSAHADSATAMAAPSADSAGAPGAAGAATAAGAGGALTSDITAAENSWRIAVTGGDTVELGRITAPGFTMVGSTGPASTVTRANLMKQVNQGMLQADSSSVSNLTVSGSGDSATADLTFFWHVSRNGKPAKAETLEVTDSWVKKDGRWQLASRKAK